MALVERMPIPSTLSQWVRCKNVDSLNVWVDAAMEGSIWLRKSDFSPTIRVSAYQTQRRRDQYLWLKWHSNGEKLWWLRCY